MHQISYIIHPVRIQRKEIPIRVITKSDDEILPFPNNLLVEPIMEHDLSLIAKFVPQSYEISLESPEGGEVSSLTPVSIL